MLAAAFSALAEQFTLITPDEEEVREACDQIRDLVSHPATPEDRRLLIRLAKLLAAADASDPEPGFSLLAELLPRVDTPAAVLSPLLTAEDDAVAARAVDLVLDLVESGQLPCDRPLLQRLARLSEREDGPLADGFLMVRLRTGVQEFYRPGNCEPGRGLQQLFVRDRDPQLRRLAAALLDLDEIPPRPEVAAQVLGKAAAKVLSPFLTYTRAGHADLMALSGGRPLAAAVVASFRDAVRDHGEAVVRRIVAALGWERVSQGLRVESFVRLEWPGVMPLLVHPEEAGLFATEPPPVVTASCRLVLARGGAPARAVRRSAGTDPVDRFRRINIAHAELLSEILEVAPADPAKVRRIVQLMDEVVATFHGLFADRAAEYRILPDIWSDLRDRALAHLARQEPAAPLSAELTRLVLAFEDPGNLGEVRTIHGLKRLLHQQGLKLGFNLVNTGQAPSQTVDMLLLPDQGEPVRGPTLRFAELEPGVEPDPAPWLPHPVRLAADGLSWQLLHGTTSFPGVDVFVFGNEVQYYITFRNHPAFLRVDFSPPQRGGMLDLEYYGVSNYETDLHPNLKLDAIRAFFRAMDLEVRNEGTRLFVRYDKERCPSLADLVEKVGVLLRFSPFLMDIDWVAGSLQLPLRLRNEVVKAWALRFRRSGIFPMDAILTRSRRQILLERVQGPAGEQEIVWPGKGPYRDRYTGDTPPGLWDLFTRQAARLGLPAPTTEVAADTGPLPLLAIHRHILDPVRRRLRSGQLAVVDGSLETGNPELCRQEHETERMALILAGGQADQEQGAVTLARPLSYLEKFVPLEITGQVGALRIERGRLTLRGGELRFYMVRDEHGVIRLGLYTLEDRLLLRRRSTRDPWQTNAQTDAGQLWALLRGANYVGEAPAGLETDVRGTLAGLREQARRHRPDQDAQLVDSAGLLFGTAAAPGRAVGQAVFGTTGRQPEDMAGCLLVAREVRPTDSQFMCRAAGIISTGGAVLSHAALLAIQFGKPALMVEAAWEENHGVPALQYRVTRYRIRESVVGGLKVCRRGVASHGSGRLAEGDICVLDAGQGMVRVLGQDADTLVLWKGFQLLVRSHAARKLAEDPQQMLEFRAQQLRARHQIKKALHRIARPQVARYALEEVVIGQDMAQLPASERAEILGELLANPAVATEVVSRLQELTADLADRHRDAARRYRELAPQARFAFEVLGLRLRSLLTRESLDLALELQRRCGLPEPAADLDGTDPAGRHPGDDPALARLEEIRDQLRGQLADGGVRTRHLLRRLERLAQVLPPETPSADSAHAQAGLAARDVTSLAEVAGQLVVFPGQCGLESHPLVGWKAANLAEMDRLAGTATVPPWCAVTDTALRRVLEAPLPMSATAAEHLGGGSPTLGQAIGRVLELPRADHAARAGLIRQLWNEVTFPDDLVAAVTHGYARLQQDADQEVFIALRSSSRDEDTETAMQAGVYDTYLFVRGVKSVLDHLRLTWSGFWTERALFGREAAGDLGRQPGGGVVLQRMVDARVSGVLQTVNIAGGNLQEMLISVGLGLGEGIVSGVAAADQVTVVKDQGPDRDPVHFNYLTNDKLTQVVFDRLRGRGTCLAETLYHQRLRPALEYTELCEVSRLALTLEDAYGYPLDIEFALEGPRLWLLQARPITAVLAEFRTTLDRYPLHQAAGLRPTTGD